MGKEDKEKYNSNKLVEIEGKEGTFYIETSSILDKYWRRPLEQFTGDIGLDGISLSQFIKRSTRGALKLKDSDMIQTLQSPEIDQDIEDDFIIALDPLKRLSIPKCFKLTSELPEDNVETMK